MNTPSHVIINLALLGRKGKQNLNTPIFIGAVLPDFTMFIFYAIQKIVLQNPERQIWDVEYYKPFWQNTFDPFNSFPLIVMAFAVAYYKKSAIWMALTASMFLHCLFDFPLHTDDAHRHFWPFSDFRLDLGISYWNPAQGWHIVSSLENIAVIIAAYFVFQILKTRISKSLLILFVILQIAMMWIFYFVF